MSRLNHITVATSDPPSPRHIIFKHSLLSSYIVHVRPEGTRMSAACLNFGLDLAEQSELGLGYGFQVLEIELLLLIKDRMVLGIM